MGSLCLKHRCRLHTSTSYVSLTLSNVKRYCPDYIDRFGSSTKKIKTDNVLKSDIQRICADLHEKRNELMDELRVINNDKETVRNRLNDLSVNIHEMEGLISRMKNDLETIKRMKSLAMNTLQHLNDTHESVIEKIQSNYKHEEYINCFRQILFMNPSDCPLWFMKSQQCIICLEHHNKITKINHCQHTVCAKCITNMLNMNINTCPLCRQKIISYESFDINTLKLSYTIHRNEKEASNDDGDDRERVTEGNYSNVNGEEDEIDNSDYDDDESDSEC